MVAWCEPHALLSGKEIQSQRFGPLLGSAAKLTTVEKMGSISWVEMVTLADAFSHLTKTCVQSGVRGKSIKQPVCSLYGYSFGPGMQQGEGMENGSKSLGLSRRAFRSSDTGLGDPWSQEPMN